MSELVTATDPAWKLNGTEGANDEVGKISEPALLAFADVKRNASYKIPVLPLAQARTEWVAENMALLKDADRSYRDEERGKQGLETREKEIEDHAGSALDDYTDAQRAEVASAMVAYIKDMRQIVSKHKDKFAKPIVGEGTDPVFESVWSPRWLRNQLFVTIRDAHKPYAAWKKDAATAKLLAPTLLMTAVSLFGTFLFLMLVFVFIKIEVDLRDIRNAMGRQPPAPPLHE